MLINNETFNETRKSKRPPMALATLAKKAGVSERTLARIKNKGEMNPSTVEKIAKALDTTVENLCSAPESMLGHERGGVEGRHIELVAARYQIAPELIEWLGPLLFVAIAELALKQRKDRLEDWWAKVEDIRNAQPKFNIGSIAEMEVESGLDSLSQAYWDEMEKIEEHSLDGWADEHFDHFFSALFSVYDGFEFEGFLPKESTPFVYGGYKYDGSFPDGKFPYPRESLKGFEYGFMEPHVLYETIWDLAGTNEDSYDPLDDNSMPPWHPIAKMAEEKLLCSFVPLSRMPIELRRKDKAFERAEWIASCGEKEEIPELFYHWEAHGRINEYRSCKTQLCELSVQLEEATSEERVSIKEELQALREKLVKCKELITPDDEEWYEKWEEYYAARANASGEEEAEEWE